MKIKIISDKNEFMDLRARWNALLQNSDTNDVYLSWEWLYTWWVIYGDAIRELHIVLVLDREDHIIGLAPFLIRKEQRLVFGDFRILEFIGTGEDEKDEVCSNYLNIIVKKCEDGPYREICEYIAGGLIQGRWDAVYLKDMPDESRFKSILNESMNDSSIFIKKVVSISDCAVIDIPGSWDEYMATLSKKWRDQIKRGRKEIHHKGEVECRDISNPEEIEPAFNEFMRLHQQKWQAEGKCGAFASDKFSRFHKGIINLWKGKYSIFFRLLKVDGRVVAASYKLKYGEKLYFYLPAYDKQFNMKIGLGLIERSYDIEEAINNGFKQYDFYKAGQNSYKWHLAKDRRRVLAMHIFRKGLKYYLYSLVVVIKKIINKAKRLCPGNQK